MSKKVDLRRDQMNRALRWAALLFLGFLAVTQQVISSGPLISFDAQIAQSPRHHFTAWVNLLLKKIDDLGLRGLTATVLIIAALFIARKFKSWRPLNLAVLSLLALNLVVGLAK